MGRRLSLVLVALFAAAPATRAEEPTPESARALLAAGRAAEAAEAFRALLARTEPPRPDAERAPLEADLARALVATGELDEALMHFEEAIRLAPRPEDRLDYAEALVAVGARNAAGPNPSSTSVTPYFADAVSVAGAVKEPAFVERAALVSAEALYRGGDAAGALERWKAVDWSKVAPARRARDLDLEARAFYDLGRFAEAAAAWHDAGSPRAEASAWAAAKDAAHAMPLYAAMLREHPDDATLLRDALTAARYANGRKELAAALAGLEAPAGAPPEARAALFRVRGLLAEEDGDPKAAEALLRQAAEADPTSAVPWIDLGRVLLDAGGASPGEAAKDAAVGAWLEGLKRQPQEARLVGVLWGQAGIDFEEGTRQGGTPSALERSLRVQRALADAAPDDPTAWANLGNTLRTTGDLAGAKEAYRRAREADPTDSSIANDEGLALLAAGDVAGALEAFGRAIELDGSISGHQNSGRLRWLAGEDDAAEAHLAGALRSDAVEGGRENLFRFLLDRVWRTRRRPDLR